MKEKKIRKTLCVKVSEDFYNEVVSFAFDNHMNLSNLIRKALFEAYGLEENSDAGQQ